MRLLNLYFFLYVSFISSLSYCLEVGDQAPDVPAVDHSGQNFDFKKQYEFGYLLVFFYPRANTPGCTAQNKSLRDGFKVLSEKSVKIIGVSTDSITRQKDFHTSLNLPFPLISDEKEIVAKAFGVPVRLGFASRQAFLIKQGKVVWVDHDASTATQAEDVLKAISTLEAKNSQTKNTQIK
jgi:peroxiredoxin Q/BCP